MIKTALSKAVSGHPFLLWTLGFVHALLFLLLTTAAAWAGEPVVVFPSTPYDGYIIYESLAVFWMAVIGLIVIIRMKLTEIERVQQMGADREDREAPLLR